MKINCSYIILDNLPRVGKAIKDLSDSMMNQTTMEWY